MQIHWFLHIFDGRAQRPAPTPILQVICRGGTLGRPFDTEANLYKGPPGCAAPTAFYQVSRRGGAPEPPARLPDKLQFTAFEKETALRDSAALL